MVTAVSLLQAEEGDDDSGEVVVVVVVVEVAGSVRKGRSLPIGTDTILVMGLSTGAQNGIAGGLAMGRKLAPLLRGRILPSAMNDTAFSDGSMERSLLWKTTVAI